MEKMLSIATRDIKPKTLKMLIEQTNDIYEYMNFSDIEDALNDELNNSQNYV